ncbi:MAG: DUF2975 domain-containing protein [Muribaculaceae bacterium]|nr:DUF2975 domain-containing protein [Muribaculaceae bacterium]
MKKTSIYILSVIVLAVLALSVILPSRRLVQLGVETFSMGFSQGYNGEESEPVHGSPIEISFVPSASTMLQPADSIQFQDGRQLPFIIDNVIVMTPDENVPDWTKWVLFSFTPIKIFFLFVILWKLIRFIINVSKARIFVGQNVTYLRQISLSLIAIAIIQIIAGSIQDYIFHQLHFTWPGYQLEAQWNFPWNNLLLGSIGLLFAQVWSYGLHIKQEQELTI